MSESNVPVTSGNAASEQAPQAGLVALRDGSIHPPSTPLIRADDLGIVRGDGVFDVAFARNGETHGLDSHLDRLAASARILSLPEPDAEGLRRAVTALIEAWDWAAAPEAVIRMVLTRGPEGGGEPTSWAMIAPLPASTIREREGIRVVVLDRGMEAESTVDLPWLLPGAKSLSYGINMAAKRYAASQGADDALFVTPSGRLLEGPTSSLVIDRGGKLLTPRQDGILKSITLEQLFSRGPENGLSIEFAELSTDDLYTLDGAWLLSSGRVLAPITHIDDREIPRSALHATLAQVLDVPRAAN